MLPCAPTQAIPAEAELGNTGEALEPGTGPALAPCVAALMLFLEKPQRFLRQRNRGGEGETRYDSADLWWLPSWRTATLQSQW